ncbi:11309_t:CDS:1, partial [Ambispora leptoticha]
QREAFQKCISILLKPIADEPEIHYIMRGNIITFIPRISTIIAYLVEAQKFTNVYQPSFTRKPCPKCLVSRDNLNNTNLTSMISRTPNTMRQAICSGNDLDYSIHPENNAFWDI